MGNNRKKKANKKPPSVAETVKQEIEKVEDQQSAVQSAPESDVSSHTYKKITSDRTL